MKMYSMDVKVPLVPRSNASVAKGGTRSVLCVCLRDIEEADLGWWDPGDEAVRMGDVQGCFATARMMFSCSCEERISREMISSLRVASEYKINWTEEPSGFVQTLRYTAVQFFSPFARGGSGSFLEYEFRGDPRGSR